MIKEPKNTDEYDNYPQYKFAKSGENNDEDVIDLKRYLLIVFQHKWILVISTLILLLLASFYAYRLPKTYTSSFSIYYEDESKVNSDFGTGIHSSLNLQYWSEIMESDRLMSLVQETSGFYCGTEKMNTFFSMTQEKKATNVFKIAMEVPNPELIQPLSSAYINSLNSLNTNDHLSGYKGISTYLNAQLKKNNDNLDKIEQEIINVSSELNINELTDLEQLKSIFENYKKQLKDVCIELSSVVATKNKLKQELSSHNDTLIHEVSFTEPLKVQLMNLQVDLARNLTKYKDDHPIVKGIRNNIAQVELMLKDGFSQNVEVKNLSANPLKQKLYGDLIQMETSEISLNAKILSLEQVISEFQKQLLPDFKDSGLSILMRKRELLLSTIGLLNEKIIDAEAALQGKNSSFILIDQPTIPTAPSNKPFILYLIIGLIGGIGLGIALILGLDFIDNRIKLVSDFEEAFAIPVLGIVRHRKTQHSIRNVVNVPYNEMSDIVQHELSEIRININQLIKDKTVKLLSVISPSRHEGKTLHSYLIAQEMARSGKKVLLVDLDTYVANLSKTLAFNNKKGIRNYLQEETSLDEIILPLKEPNLNFIAAGTKLYDTPIYYDTTRVNLFLNEVNAQYDMVIFDTPALLFIPEIISFLEKVHGLIFITKINYTRRNDMDKLLKKIQKVDVQKIGAVLTDVKETPLDKYYNNYYYYDYKYWNNDDDDNDKVKRLRTPYLLKYKKRTIASVFLAVLLALILGFAYKISKEKKITQQITFEQNINIDLESLSDSVVDHRNDIINKTNLSMIESR